VVELQTNFGGGKTHTLITLNHLVAEPSALPDLPAVKEFVQHIGMTPPKARVAVLAFDKLDPEKFRVEEYGRLPLSYDPPSGRRKKRDRFGFFGQFSHYKGVNVVLKAMKRLVEEVSARPAAPRAIALKDKFTFKAEMDDEARANMFRHLKTQAA
jgi:glycosyltransferase involved in cell wall biosynthesis